MAYLLSFIDAGELHAPDYRGPRVADIREWVELTRRLAVPHYEEARRYWTAAREDQFFDGADEIFPYLPSTSLTIISEYGPYVPPTLEELEP